MKNSIQNIRKIIFLISLFFTLFSAQAQAPQAFSYQAVIRNSGNALVANTVIAMRISIFQGLLFGTATYVETQTATTNANGLATIKIGNGTVTTGVFSSINWSLGTYYVKTETDISGGSNYTIVATSQLLSVPYALSSADNKWASTPNGNGINTTADNVGIGTLNPTSKLNVNGQVTIDQKNFGGYGGLLIKGGNTVSNYPNIAMSVFNANATDVIAAYISGVPTNAASGNVSMDLTFATSQTGLDGISEKMIIKSGGNIGIGTLTPTTKLEVNGFTKLGTDSPAIIVKKLTGSTSSLSNGIVSIPHGLNSAKILAVNVLLEYQPGQFIPQNYTKSFGQEFHFGVLSTAIVIENTNTNSNSILSKPIRILITYEE